MEQAAELETQVARAKDLNDTAHKIIGKTGKKAKKIK